VEHTDEMFPVAMLEPEDPPPSGRGSLARFLLEDVPEEPEGEAVVRAPRAGVSSHEAEAIAKKYEQELRQKLEHTAEIAQRSFAARHRLKIAVGTVIGVASAVGLGFYVSVRAAHHGQDLKDDLANAKKAIAQDTRKSYQFALERLAHAVQMDDGSEEAWALTAYARGVLHAEHGGGAENRAKGRAALDRPRVRERFPGLALASDYYLAEGAGRDELKKGVLESRLEQAEVQELAGRILLARKDSKGAVERFRRALNANPANVRALVALGDYYREFGDFSAALKFYGTASQISAHHPARVIGASESRLALSQELGEALKEMEELASDEVLPPDLLARRELAHGRLLACGGNYERAIRKLSEGARSFKLRAFEFNLALGEASRAGGKMEIAQNAFEAALALKPKSEEAKEALGKVLIARDRERELLSRFPPEPDGRKMPLVRGMAFAKLQDWKRARAELGRTEVNGKFPTEAAIYLALADAAEGQPERAQAVLEKFLAASRKPKSELRVALGNVYWQRGALDKARAQFEEARKAPEEYEGPCALGRLLLSLGSVEEAIETLVQAVNRNSNHGESRRALGRAYLEAGKVKQAVAQLEAWRSEQPSSGAAHNALALALFRTGNLKEAESTINRALKLNPDSEAHRIRAMLYFARGEPRSGLKELERATKSNPKDVETLCENGAALVRFGRSESAVKAYEAALREDSGHPCGQIGVYYARLPAGGKAAARDLSELSQKAPQAWNKAFAKSTLARVLLANGSPKEARKAAEQAIALDPSAGTSYLALGLIALRQRDDVKAREALGRAAQLEPSHGLARLAWADALAKSEETRSQAVEQYQMFLRIGGAPADQLRVKRQLVGLKKKVALR
jgi:tetratricopeptide (TPR) repeat protein